MRTNAVQWMVRSFILVAAATLFSGCGGDTSVAPDRAAADLKGCENLQVPATGGSLAFHVYAKGVQIYRWSGTNWTFVEPSAVLFDDPQATDAVGIHYAGPTWLGVSGSKVVGSVIERCTPDAKSIPWLLLGAVSADGPGVFQRTSFIQRLNTVGGNAPAAPGSVAGELASVPYTAEYLFYRAQ